VARSPAVIVTEELGKNPQEEMIGVEEKAKKGVRKKVKKGELRHRIKQIPFKKLVGAVEDKAAERGSVVVYVSPYRNSKVYPHPLRAPEGQRRLAYFILSPRPRC